jgi:hypothetical protein
MASLLLSSLKSISTFTNIRLSCHRDPINTIILRSIEQDRTSYRNTLSMNQSSLYFVSQRFTTNLSRLEATGYFFQPMQRRIRDICPSLAMSLTSLRLTMMLLQPSDRLHIYSSLTKLKTLEISYGKNQFDRVDLKSIAAHLPLLQSLNLMEEFRS